MDTSRRSCIHKLFKEFFKNQKAVANFSLKKAGNLLDWYSDISVSLTVKAADMNKKHQNTITKKKKTKIYT